MDQERLLDALATWCKARYGRQRQLAQGYKGFRADGQRLDRPPKDAQPGARAPAACVPDRRRQLDTGCVL